MDELLETQVGILETGGNLQHDGCVFRLRDVRGKEPAYWEMSLPHMGGVLACDPFWWNGKLWVRVFGMHDGDYDTRLIPVAWPEGV